MAAHVADIQRKFTARIWALQNLGRLGMGKPDLLAVYKSTILPMHDYCSTVFNSSLTITQSGQLERIQAMAQKAIFGFDHSYRSLLSLSGLTSLKARRDERATTLPRDVWQTQGSPVGSRYTSQYAKPGAPLPNPSTI